MKPLDPNQGQVEAQHRTLLILWTVMLLSVIGFALLAVLVPSNATGNQAVVGIVLIALGTMNVFLSITVKRGLLKKSVENQDIQTVLRAYVIAWALSESAALFGLIIHFVAASASAYVAFGVGIIGMVLHVPQKKHLLDVFFKPV